MRFGHSLSGLQIPGWEEFYIRYDLLKRLLHEASVTATAQAADADFTEPSAVVAREVQKVEAFYVKSCSSISSALHSISRHYGLNLSPLEPVDVHSLNYGDKRTLLAFFVEIYTALEQVQWFAHVNTIGFQRFFRKIQKAQHQTSAQSEPSVLSFHFVARVGLSEDLQLVRNIVRALTDSTWELASSHTTLPARVFSDRLSSAVHDANLSDTDAATSPWTKELPSRLDWLGRSPLHQAAAFGLSDAAEDIIKDIGTSNASWDLLLHRDFLGQSALFLAVVKNHFQIAQSLLKRLRLISSSSPEHSADLSKITSSLLAVSVKTRNLKMMEMLLHLGADPNHRGTSGETPVYIAAREGFAEGMRLLLQAGSETVANINLAETQCGRTPLMISCAEGHLPVLKLLLASNARQDLRDMKGWTAKEHAAFRGHLDIAASLDHPGTEDSSERRLQAIQPHKTISPILPPAKTVQSLIYVTLGPANTRSEASFIEMTSLAVGDFNTKYAAAGFYVEVIPVNATGLKTTIQLPVIGDLINEPLIFETKSPKTAQLKFNLYRGNTNDLTSASLVGTGVSLLHSLRQGFSEGREGLHRDYTIPILTLEGFDLAATITISFFMAHSYMGKRSNAMPRDCHGFWKAQGPTQVVGHRGSGANKPTIRNLQIGENTVYSLESAMTLGACAVEFIFEDVQLTKDFIPVIYHNFLCMESGGEATMWNLTRDQFVYFGESQGPRGALSHRAETRYCEKTETLPIRPRSRSIDVYDDDRMSQMTERMGRTAEAREKGIRGNLRGLVVQEQFPTFKDLLTKLPDTVSFDVEMKYPMLWESQDQDWEPYTVELNTFIDTVLDLIYEFAGKRNIVFSSFSPEICICLSAKQQDFPILFINKVGQVKTGDSRASSLQNAVAFAKRWGLAGIVPLSDPVVLAPRLIRYAKDKGLVVASYGDLNDEPKFAKVQAHAGIDAIITNKVKLIVKTLADVTQ